MGWGFESPWAYHRPGQPRTRSGTLARILLATPAFPSHTRLYTTGGTSHTVNDLPLKNNESRRKHLLERRDNRSMNSPNPLKNEKSSSVLGGAVTGTLLITIALHNAVPPLATDMYSPAFPEITTDLSTSASAVGFTLTAFFIGFGAGQIGGGALSDQRGRRGPSSSAVSSRSSDPSHALSRPRSSSSFSDEFSRGSEVEPQQQSHALFSLTLRTGTSSRGQCLFCRRSAGWPP